MYHNNQLDKFWPENTVDDKWSLSYVGNIFNRIQQGGYYAIYRWVLAEFENCNFKIAIFELVFLNHLPRFFHSGQSCDIRVSFDCILMSEESSGSQPSFSSHKLSPLQ